MVLARSRSPCRSLTLDDFKFCLDDVTAEWDCKHAEGFTPSAHQLTRPAELLEAFGVCRLLGVLPLGLVEALRKHVLEKCDVLVEDGAFVGTDVYVHAPENRRHITLTFDDTPVSEACKSAASILRSSLGRVLGLNATVVELAALVSSAGAVSQPVHRDVGKGGREASKVVIVQMVLQDTSDSMGPLTVEPGTHLQMDSSPVPRQTRHECDDLAIVAPAGSLIVFDGCVRHYGGAHRHGPDRAIAYFTLMQEKGVGRPAAVGSTWALGAGLWGRYTLASLPNPCTDACVPKWTFEVGQLGCPLLQAAGVLGDIDALRQLLQSVDMHKGPHATQPLHAAAKCGRVAIVRYLLAGRASANAISAEGHAPIHLAAEGGHAAVAELLVAGRADIGAKDQSPSGAAALPLHLAAWRGHEAVVRLLLCHAACAANAQDSEGASPLHRAANSGHLAILRVLLDASSDPNAADNRGFSPLHAAAFAGHTPVVAQMLAARAQIGSADCRNATALHWAAAGGHLPVVEQLIARGSELTVRMCDGRTAKEIARVEGHSQVVNYLTQVEEATLEAD